MTGENRRPRQSLAGLFNISFGFFGIGSKGLLAKDVFAGFERCDRPVTVQAVRKGVVDCVDVRVGKHRVIAAE